MDPSLIYTLCMNFRSSCYGLNQTIAPFRSSSCPDASFNPNASPQILEPPCICHNSDRQAAQGLRNPIHGTWKSLGRSKKNRRDVINSASVHLEAQLRVTTFMEELACPFVTCLISCSHFNGSLPP